MKIFFFLQCEINLVKHHCKELFFEIRVSTYKAFGTDICLFLYQTFNLRLSYDIISQLLRTNFLIYSISFCFLLKKMFVMRFFFIFSNLSYDYVGTLPYYVIKSYFHHKSVFSPFNPSLCIV